MKNYLMVTAEDIETAIFSAFRKAKDCDNRVYLFSRESCDHCGLEDCHHAYRLAVDLLEKASLKHSAEYNMDFDTAMNEVFGKPKPANIT
jgi:hypothetical protein